MQEKYMVKTYLLTYDSIVLGWHPYTVTW